MYLGPMAPDPGRFYKLLIVDTGESGHGMSHYHYGQIVLGMPRLHHILLLRKCVYIRLILRKLLWTLNEWCFQKKEEHKKAIPNAHICASGGGHNLGARACKACRYFLYVLLVTLPENSAYWHLTSNWGCEYNEICWVTNCREPWLRFTWQPAGGWRPAQRAQLIYQVYLVLWNGCTNLNWQLLQSDSRRLHHLDHILNYSAEFSFQSFYLLLSNMLLFSFFSGHIDFL